MAEIQITSPPKTPPLDTSSPEQEAGEVSSFHPKKIIAQIRKYVGNKSVNLSKLLDILSGLFSIDAPTRKMSTVFIFSLIGILSVFYLALDRYWMSKRGELRHQSKELGNRFEELVRKRSEEAERRASVMSVGSFTLDLKEDTTQVMGTGIANMAELEIIIYCDGRETRNFIQSHLIEVRDQISHAFIGLSKDDLMSREGKKRIKKTILKILNAWMPHGKVSDLYISKLIIN